MTNRTYDTPEIQELKEKLIKALDGVGAGYCIQFYDKDGPYADYKTVPVIPVVVSMVKQINDGFILKVVDEMDNSHDTSQLS